MLRETITLDPEGVWNEIITVDQEVRFAGVGLLTALAPLALLVPSWAFRLLRHVLLSRPSSLPVQVPRPWVPIAGADASTHAIRVAADQPQRHGSHRAYVPSMRESQCGSCTVRWTIYDTGSLEQYWRGDGWPRKDLTFTEREAQPGRIWVPLPTRAGKFVVKLELVDSKGKVRAGADSPVIELTAPANPSANDPRK